MGQKGDKRPHERHIIGFSLVDGYLERNESVVPYVHTYSKIQLRMRVGVMFESFMRPNRDVNIVPPAFCEDYLPGKDWMRGGGLCERGKGGKEVCMY